MKTITYDFSTPITQSPFEGYKTAKRLNEAIEQYGAKVTIEKDWLFLNVGSWKEELYNVNSKSCRKTIDYEEIKTLTATGTDSRYGYDDNIKARELPIIKDGEYFYNSEANYANVGRKGCTHAFLYTLTQITIEAIKAFEAIEDEVIEYKLVKAE